MSNWYREKGHALQHGLLGYKFCKCGRWYMVAESRYTGHDVKAEVRDAYHQHIDEEREIKRVVASS